jgi:hypothetical protein
MGWRMDWVSWVSWVGGLEPALSRGGGHLAAGMGLAIRARVCLSRRLQCENGGIDAPARACRDGSPPTSFRKKATHEHFSPDLGPDPSR